ncbi:MAG: E3 binding domain-containing protein [Deltaproteobacteria bacterium]|nr:E3 binding domain-containing protein [Deltaproteobacteria bacterium]
MQAVVMPILEANMTHGVIRVWHKREGDQVKPGEPLFEVETDKVNAEVEAEVSGVVRRIVAPVGTRVAVLGVLALVGSADEPLPAAETWGALTPAGGPAAGVEPAVPPAPPAAAVLTPAPGRPAASPAARRLARERGIAIEQIRGTGSRGEITRADVEAATSTAAVASAPGDGTLDPAFFQLLRRDPAAFRALAGDSKLQLYREHGARIGEGVRLEAGAIIIARNIAIGAASIIGADSTIECERLQLGRLAAFGKRTRVRCRSLEIGDALWSKDDVMIGGGGSDESGAHLRAGHACFFGEAAYLNPCHPVTLGDEVCIGSRAMLFTHSHWQSVLRGYPSLFGPITVGDHVFIGNQAFVFPGVTIGAGATVMVNSFVAINVPPATLVGGVPAQVIRHISAPARAEQVALVRERLLPELAAHLRQQGYPVVEHTSGDISTLELGREAALVFAPAWQQRLAQTSRARLVLLSFVEGDLPAVTASTTLFDLNASRVSGMQDRLSDEVREFCRRRGIRFRPYAWRYGVGNFDADRFCPRTAG